MEDAGLGEAVNESAEAALCQSGRKEEGGEGGAEDEGEGKKEKLLAGGSVGEAEAVQLEVEEEEEEGEEDDAEIGGGGGLRCFHLLSSPRWLCGIRAASRCGRGLPAQCSAGIVAGVRGSGYGEAVTVSRGWVAMV